MDVKKRLEEWKNSHPDGVYETLSTITVKTKSMNVSVSGSSLEEAFSQLEGICKGEEKVAPATNSFLSTNNTLATPVTEEAKALTDLLKGRTLLRMHTPSIPLAPNEDTIVFNGTTWVVTGGVK